MRIDVEKAIVRFMGNEGLYAKMLKKFLDDANYENLVNAISEKNDDDALVASHTPNSNPSTGLNVIVARKNSNRQDSKE